MSGAIIPRTKRAARLRPESFIELTGEFQRHPQYGLEARKWTRAAAYRAGKKRITARSRGFARQADGRLGVYQANRAEQLPIRGCVLLCEDVLNEWGDRFRRTAAARNYHHARRGGLVEHTAQMMRVAKEIAPLYPQLNLDLLLAGILFHDSGKLWENRSAGNGLRYELR